MRAIRSCIIAAAIGAACSAGVCAAAQPQPIGCIIEPDEVVEVGSPVIGVIQSIVKRGDRVRKGQVVAVLRNNVDLAALSVAQSRAVADADEKAALANYEFSRQRRERAEELVRKEFISKQALDQSIAEDEVARQKLAQAREQRRILAREASLAQQRLEERNIRSPIDGLVVERYLTAGERVEEKPLLRVVRIDPLRVEAILSSALFGTVATGSIARIQPDMPNAVPVTATVTLVDKVLDAASGTFRVRMRLPNRDGAVPAGLRCKVEFTGQVQSEMPKASNGDHGTASPAAKPAPRSRARQGKAANQAASGTHNGKP
jgi:membrane fusion protein, heavy metal efflux system